MSEPFCPACKGNPLTEVRRSKAKAPVFACQNCWGLWATGVVAAATAANVLAREPALRIPVRRWRCLECGGETGENDRCTDCGAQRPERPCPSCSAAMSPTVENGVTVDLCGPCKGAWFDSGEFAVACGLDPGDAQSRDAAIRYLAARAVGDRADGGEKWQGAGHGVVDDVLGIFDSLFNAVFDFWLWRWRWKQSWWQ